MTTTTGLSYGTAPHQAIHADNGIDYTYREIGPGTVPLVLSQRFRGNLENWDPQLADALASQRRDVAFDNVPAVVLHGRRDIPIPFDRGGELARTLPGSGPIADIDEARHTPPVSHPEHTLEAVTRFCANTPGSHIMTVPGDHYLGHLPPGGHHRECGSHSRIDQHQQA